MCKIKELLHQRWKGKAKPNNKQLPCKVDNITSDGTASPAMKQVVAPSDFSRMISIGIWLYNLSSFSNKTETRLLAVGVSRGVPLLCLT